MNYVVADIHGEHIKLKLLINNILSIDANAGFIFIGDYIDKGEDSYKTLQYLTDFSNKHTCSFLRGNHEYYWELLQDDQDKYAAYILKYGGKNTIYSIDKSLTIVEAKKLLFSEFDFFFKSLKNYYIAGNYVITHSGIPPRLFLTDIATIDTEDFLFNRYDFIKTEKLFFDKKIIFGHTGFYYPYYDGYKIGIDTAACYLPEQPLTAFCIEGAFFINSSNSSIQLSSIDQSCCPVIPRVTAWRQL